MTKELLQQCLDALAPHGSSYANGRRTAEDEAITAIEQSLAQQEQPAKGESATWTEMVVVNLVREGVNKHKARELAAHFLTLFAPPTQPALSDERIDDIAWNYLDKDQKFQWLAFARAIEAHCRGGNHG